MDYRFRKSHHILSVIMTFALVLLLLPLVSPTRAEASSKPKLNAESGMINVGGTKKIYLESDVWTIDKVMVRSSNKEVATGKSKIYGQIDIKGKAAGEATLTIKVKAFKYVNYTPKSKTFKLKYIIKVVDSSDFSQYVYEENGYTCFKYTGSGDTHIFIPEGVEYIRGFVSTTTEFNTEITHITLPSTLKKMDMYCMFNKVDDDPNWYNCLYQCSNLTTVDGGWYWYLGNGSSVTRPGEITVWSANERVPYDEQKYIDYNNRVKDDEKAD